MTTEPLYWIRGADGLEYGPVSAEQVRVWVAEHRANAVTRVRLEGSEEVRELGQVPEFSGLFGGSTPPRLGAEGPSLGAAGVGAGLNPGEALTREVLARGYTVRIGECLSRGWGIIQRRFWLTVGATFLVYVLYLGLSFIPVLGGVASLLLFFVVMGGLDMLFLRLLRGQPADMGTAFCGFGPGFVNLMISGLIASVLTGVLGALGLVLCVLPGLAVLCYLLVSWWMFAPLLILDKGLDFWQALECSRRVVGRHWWVCFGLLLVATILGLSGVLILVVGLAVTTPLATAMIVVAYEQIFGVQADPGVRGQS